MRVKKTSKNRITLPKLIADRFAGVDDFDVHGEGGRIVLVPVLRSRADAVRAKLDAILITYRDVENAVAWARQRT